MSDSIVQNVLIEEFNRSQEMLKIFERELENYPKGRIYVRNIKGQLYVYRSVRVKNKVNSLYLGKPEHLDLSQIKLMTDKRDNIKLLISKTKKELIEITRYLNRVGVKTSEFID